MFCRSVIRSFVLAVALAATWAHAAPPASQPSGSATSAPAARHSLSREEELHLLEARQAQLNLDQAKAAMEKARVEREQILTLFKEKLVTIEDLNKAIQGHDQAVLAHEQAKIEQEKKRLEFLKDATLVTVIDAKKYRGEEGEVIASVRLRNDSDISKARIAMGNIEGLSLEHLQSLLKVDNVIVTLKGEVQIVTGTGQDKRSASSGKAIVGVPFQRIVPELAYGREVELEYRLIKKDVEAVTVSLEFLGTTKNYDVFLKKESSQDLPVVSSAQYSQIGRLGSKIKYDLDLERLAKTEQGFSLVVLNLPQEIKASILDSSSQAIITEVRFTEEVSKQRLYLELSIPEKLDRSLIDANITFYFMATRRSELRTIFGVKEKHKGKTIPPEEIATLKARRVELTLIPRGVGKLDIMAPNLFKEAEQDQPVSLKFNIMNSGTLVLRRVKATLDLPLEWEGQVVPKEADSIAGGEKTLFTVNLQLPPDVEVGEYTVKVQAEGHSGVEIIEALDKDFTVRIVSESSLTGTVILVGVLVVLVLVIAIASIKISRR